MFNPSNWCTIEPHQRPWRERKPHLKSWTCLEIPSCCTCWYSTSSRASLEKKEGCRGFQLCRHWKHNRSPRQRPVVQHNDNDEVRPSKRPTVPLYLDESTEKCKFRDQVEGSRLLPRKVFPQGFMPPWRIQHESHTCSEQSLRILMWNASYVQKHSSYTWQEWVNEKTREKSKSYHRHSQS